MEPTNQRCYLYVKFREDTQFRAWNDDTGNYAIKLIYCTTLLDTAINREKLQNWANRNKAIGLRVQLRKPENNQITFQTNEN